MYVCIWFYHLTPSSKKGWEDTWSQSLITNFFSINLLQYEWNHHKQNLSLLVPTSNYKDITFLTQINLNVNGTTISPTIMGYKTMDYVTYLQGRQGKDVWLTARQLLMKAGWWDAPFALQDLAETIFMHVKSLIFMSSLIHRLAFALEMFFFSNMFCCHCRLVTVDWPRC